MMYLGVAMRIDEFLPRLRNQTQSPKPLRSREPNLAIPAETFNDEAVLCLIDDWIVPALVEEFLHSKKSFTSGEDGA